METNQLANLHQAAQQLVAPWYGGRRVLAILLKIEGEGEPLALPVASLDAAPDRITDKEACVLEAVAPGEAPTAEEIAKRVGEENGPNLRSLLSGMRQRGLLGGARGSAGYPRGARAPA